MLGSDVLVEFNRLQIKQVKALEGSMLHWQIKHVVEVA